jgi:superfamily II DNA or RNA helicase
MPPPPGMNEPLLTELAPYFSDVVRDRGARYHLAGRVMHLRGSAFQVEAVVRGSRSYNAAIYIEKNTVEFACSCPFFEDGEPCKHLWALVLAASEHGHLTGLNLPETLRHMQRPGTARPGASSRAPLWQSILHAVSEVRPPDEFADGAPEQLIAYTLDGTSAREGGQLVLQVTTQTRRRNGAWGQPKPLNIARLDLSTLPQAVDRKILSALQGSTEGAYYGYTPRPTSHALSAAQVELLLPLLCETGRFSARTPEGNLTGALALDEGEPWRLSLQLETEAGKNYRLSGRLQRGTETMNLSEPALLLSAGWVFTRERMARLDHADAFPWIIALRQTGPVSIPGAEVGDFLRNLYATPHLPPITVPDELALNVRPAQPTVKLLVRQHPSDERAIRARLVFDYAGTTFDEGDARSGSLDWSQRMYQPRDRVTERESRRQLLGIGFSRQTDFIQPDHPYLLPSHLLPHAIRTLLRLGWIVEASGKIYREARAFTLKVASGTDWFDLHGQADFNGASVSLPALLKAIRNGENTVRLDDGSLGLLPEDWLRRMGTLAALGEESAGRIRFQRDQALLLDALLAEQPGVDVDAAFDRVRTELRNFQAVEAHDAPAGFRGTLRPYQREGLGWFDFLRRFGFGGCLADDMGLGKTVQVLALLEKRRLEKAGPSLVVVPRSLMFNWRQEAERFTPALRILEHSGIGRARSSGHLSDYDLILTTYGTLRRDAILLKEIAFDYVILDEAQAIKNAATHSAKAARLLRARHRLALSGTPVENHLGELWSLFEFLNPGMMGRSSAFSAFTGNDVAPDMRHLLARALRPFILRRTKGQVATELPARLEQTIHCDLPAPQRKLYNELRDYYRQSLLKKVTEQGLGRSKIMVLEALLRLRQAACHPGLVDKTRNEEESAKLSALIPQLLEVTQEGHKALVFSQFTSFLSLVKKQVEAAGLTYEYLDGKTKDRQARVDRFQNDPECRLFLISLRAGGLGLNLTAAEYVFLLDPWWNPAVEAQAIDRAHRIGQQQRVFAYRIIARDTIEEKVLELQAGKRDLASAIITEDQSILRNLTREDLELLLT